MRKAFLVGLLAVVLLAGCGRTITAPVWCIASTRYLMIRDAAGVVVDSVAVHAVRRCRADETPDGD